MPVDRFELAQNQAEICGVFGNAHRVLIVWALVDGERTVSDIAAAVGCSLQNASQHLRLMKDKGLLTSRRDGNTIYYGLTQDNLRRDCQLLCVVPPKPTDRQMID
jgi:DNA-binding transcriptional ArsR family regulator